ncbi:hypothetical protein MM239_02090 [Belliella sp. DSM 111904]|uniref:Lipoprotein n=1 Tax=Belliella filtrata TaxID=2923435 RepID=A0ABS9UVK8_9BACT|nr:hypothetical protein [Belliella filtrata]MCH7408171.1 hypothetical protein [Belliella filtrata]
MKHVFLIFSFLLIVACSTKTEYEDENILDQKTQDLLITEEEEYTQEILKGERIDGPANVRDKKMEKLSFL